MARENVGNERTSPSGSPELTLASAPFLRWVVSSGELPAWTRGLDWLTVAGSSPFDEAFLAEAEKRRLEIDPTKWDEMESLAKDVMVTPPDVVVRMRKLLGE